MTECTGCEPHGYSKGDLAPKTTLQTQINPIVIVDPDTGQWEIIMVTDGQKVKFDVYDIPMEHEGALKICTLEMSKEPVAGESASVSGECVSVEGECEELSACKTAVQVTITNLRAGAKLKNSVNEDCEGGGIALQADVTTNVTLRLETDDECDCDDTKQKKQTWQVFKHESGQNEVQIFEFDLEVGCLDCRPVV